MELPFLRGRSKERKERAMILLQHKILANVLLRRTKSERHSDLTLPPRIISVRRDTLDAKEEDYYQALCTSSQTKFNISVKEGSVMKIFVHISEMFTRLRQGVDHPYLVIYSESVANNGADPVEDDTVGTESQRAKSKGKQFRSSSILNKIHIDDFQTSTKIEALSGITCVMLEGSMTVAAREKAVKRFHEDPDCRILLSSLKSGGVALNLSVASHVFLMDPWWNPAMERQAMDRVHRIGQRKPMRVVRFVMEGTVEDRLLQLQEKKSTILQDRRPMFCCSD